MAKSTANNFFLHLCLLLLVQFCCLHICTAHELTQIQSDSESNNNFLKNYIWSKIISVSKSSPASSPSTSSSTSSRGSLPNIPLVTIPYKPSASLSRRSSYSSSGASSAQNSLIASASSSNYIYEPSGNSIASKYFSDSKSSLSSQPFGQYNPMITTTTNQAPSTTTLKPPVSQVKSSYSGSESGKNYFVTAFQPQSESGGGSSSMSKSLYDLVPMPTYGYSKFGGGADENNLYQKKRTLEIVPMIGEGGKQYGGGQPMEPQIIEVAPDDQPIQVVFRSTSTRVQVKQIHTPLKPEEVETTRTEEEPQRVVHQLLRPVIQEVFEVIQPYRKVTQEVRPVLEEVHTVVSKAAPNGQGQGPQHGPGMGGNQGGMYQSGNNMPPPTYRPPPYGQSSNYNGNSNRGSSNHQPGAYGTMPNFG